MRACRLSQCNILAVVVLAAAGASAQLEITSSPNVVGSGARALGMGAAFIAIADDATAASWNPGGLTQLERPEVSLVYSYKWLNEDFSSELHPELGGEHSVNFNEINYASFVYPIRRTIAGRNLVLSLNYQRKYDFDRDLNVTLLDENAGALGTTTSVFSRTDYSQRGGLSALSPAFGFEITNKLSVGMVLNIWNKDLLPDNEWKVRRDIRTRVLINGEVLPISFGRTTIDEDYDDFKGINYTIGMLYKPNERWSLGAVYNSKFTADVKYTRTEWTLGGLGRVETTRNQEYVFPASFGIGAAYRFPNDKLTLSFDITRREWGQFIIHDPENRDASLRRRSGVTGLSTANSEVDPTYTIRMGAEYVFVDASKPVQKLLPSIRGGIFYDPEPSGGRKNQWFAIGTNTLGKGDGDPDDYFGFTLGGGVLIGNRVNLDMAYTYRWGEDVRADSFGLGYTDADVDQHLLYFSTVIYF